MSGINYSLDPRLNGQVLNQAGNPVENATVQVTTVDTTQISAPDPVSEAYGRIENASQTTPDNWDRSLDLRSQTFDTDAEYAALTQTDVGGDNMFVDSADLSDPQLTFPEGEEIVVTSWDGSKTGGLAPQGEYDTQLPGSTTDTAVVIEQLSVTGETTDTQTVELDQEAGGGLVDPSTLDYGTVRLSAGYYRVSPENSEVSYMIQVGDPTEVIDEELQNIQNKATDRSKWLTDQINNGPMGMKTTTTNASGSFSVVVPDNVKVVAIQAYKADTLDTAPAKLSVADMRTNATDLSGSIYTPSRVYEREVPAKDVTIRMTETTWPQYANASAFQDRYDDRLADLLNQSFDELPAALQGVLENQSREDLENVTAQLENLTEQNEELRQRYETLLNDQQNIDVNVDDASDEELRARIAALQQTVESMEPTVVVERTEPESGILRGGDDGNDGTDSRLTRAWTIPGDVSSDGTLVRIDYSNGTTEYLDSDNDAVSINNRLARSDVVTLSEYDIGNAAAAEVSIIAATDQGVGRASETVVNPAVDENIPTLQSVSMSTLEPATGENTSIELTGGDNFRRLESASVFDASGNSVPTAVDNGTAEFAPTSAGTHTVKLTFSNFNGTTFEETYRFQAATNGQDRPASVRAKSGPTGTYALVGEGLQGGDLRVKNGGSNVEVTATAPGGQVPSRVHVYTAGLALSPDSTVTVSVVQGDQQRAISQNVRTIIHGPAYSDRTYLYRVADGNEEPLPRGKSKTGIVDVRDTNSTVQTYTTSEGQVGLRANTDPGLIEQAQWFIATRAPDIPTPDVPGIGMLGGPIVDLNGVMPE